MEKLRVLLIISSCANLRLLATKGVLAERMCDVAERCGTKMVRVGEDRKRVTARNE